MGGEIKIRVIISQKAERLAYFLVSRAPTSIHPHGVGRVLSNRRTN